MESFTERVAIVAGPTGSGKTTLSRALSQLSDDVTVVAEPDVHMLHGSASAATWFETQLAVIRLRATQLRQVTTHLALMDRHFSEDRVVFFQLHLELGNVSYGEYEALVAEAIAIERRMPVPESVIYLIAADDVLRVRMRGDGHPEWLIGTLDRQLVLYAQWLQDRTERLLHIDTSNGSLLERASEALDWLRADE